MNDATETMAAASVARARAALESSGPVEVHTRTRVLAMIRALVDRCREYQAAAAALEAELRCLRGS